MSYPGSFYPGSIFALGAGGGGGTPAGVSNDIQINTAGAFDVVAQFTCGPATNILNIPGVIQGKQIHSNAQPVTGANTQEIRSGEYTPTTSALVNLSAATIGNCGWMRVGNVITFSGQITVDAILAGACSFTFDLPIVPGVATSNISGVASDGVENMRITKSGTGLAAIASWTAANLAAHSFGFTVTYILS